MFSIHILNSRPDIQPALVDETRSIYRSQCWIFELAEAREAIGGWLYLHKTKGQSSFHGGKIIEVEHCHRPDEEVEDGVAFIYEARLEGKGQSWRGKSHGMAWNGGFQKLALSHERVASETAKD